MRFIATEPTLKINRIRISCACLCRIEHDGRYFLLLNASRRSRGIYVLAPVGGALSLYDLARLEEFDATFDDPSTRDLRLTMPVAALPAFRQWFYSGEGREQSPFRELQEELVEEAGLLPSLEAGELKWRLLWTAEDEGFTQRHGQTGMLTHYFLEIYDVCFSSSKACERLLAASPDSGGMWVTQEQIDQRARLNLVVDGVAQQAQVNGYLLLHPPEVEEGD